MTLEGFRMDSGYIVMKPGPERDRKLDQTIENIRAAAEYFGVHVSETDWHDLMRG